MSLILQPYFNLHWVLIYEKSGRDMPFKVENKHDLNIKYSFKKS